MAGNMKNRSFIHELKTDLFPDIDELDLKLIKLLALGHTNNEIAEIERVPLSTVQKRTRSIIKRGIINIRYEPNYTKLGFKTGLIHICVSSDNVYEIAEKFSKIDGVQSVSLHVGNFDILGLFLYKNTKQLMGLVSEVKRIEGIEKIAWSEEVYTLPLSKHDPLSIHSELK
jgi:DNA-binding Lrp family transcriptional regulator